MEDTLRYFFSAVFQGFAALITLGIMFYLYYMDKLSGKTEKIESKLLPLKPGISGEGFTIYEREGIIGYMKKSLLPKKKDLPSYDYLRMRVSQYDSIEEQKITSSAKMEGLFKIARVILLLSLISLFLVGYYEWLNYLLTGSGILCIVLSIVFFKDLYAFSKQIMDRPI